MSQQKNFPKSSRVGCLRIWITAFFSDSGSVAVEVALKIALQYYMNREEIQRTMVLALEHAYHGDTSKLWRWAMMRTTILS